MLLSVYNWDGKVREKNFWGIRTASVSINAISATSPCNIIRAYGITEVSRLGDAEWITQLSAAQRARCE